MRPTSTELLAKTCAWGDDRLSAPPGTIHAGRVRGVLQELQLRMEGASQAHKVRPLRRMTRYRFDAAQTATTIAARFMGHLPRRRQGQADRYSRGDRRTRHDDADTSQPDCIHQHVAATL